MPSDIAHHSGAVALCIAKLCSNKLIVDLKLKATCYTYVVKPGINHEPSPALIRHVCDWSKDMCW